MASSRKNTHAQLKNTLNIHAVLHDGFFLPGRARGGYVSNCIIWSGTCHSIVSSFIFNRNFDFIMVHRFAKSASKDRSL